MQRDHDHGSGDGNGSYSAHAYGVPNYSNHIDGRSEGCSDAYCKVYDGAGPLRHNIVEDSGSGWGSYGERRSAGSAGHRIAQGGGSQWDGNRDRRNEGAQRVGLSEDGGFPNARGRAIDTSSMPASTLAHMAMANATISYLESEMGSVIDPKFEKDANIHHETHLLLRIAVFRRRASQLAPGVEYGHGFQAAVAEALRCPFQNVQR